MQVCKSRMCMSANRICVRHYSRDLPGHRRYYRNSQKGYTIPASPLSPSYHPWYLSSPDHTSLPVTMTVLMLAFLRTEMTGVVSGFREFFMMISPPNSRSHSTMSLYTCTHRHAPTAHTTRGHTSLFCLSCARPGLWYDDQQPTPSSPSE